jgi:hypothetical protein
MQFGIKRRLILGLAILLADLPLARAEPDKPLRVEGALHFSRARIITTSDRHYLAREVTVSGDSVSFTRVLMGKSVGYEAAPPSKSDYRQLPLAKVDRIEVVGGNRAAMGAGIGALAGMGLWALIAQANNESLGETVFWGMLIFIIPGAGIGALVGSGAEDWDTVYEREP